MNKALSREAREQPLDDTLLKMHLNYFFGDDSGIFEDHGPDRRGATPFPELLITRTRSAETVHRLGPRGIGAGTLIKSGKHRPPRILTVRLGLKRVSAHHF
jgi:hypothetical protein